MFWIALAAALLNAAQPMNYKSWFSSADMPERLENEGGTWTIGVRAVIRPDGTLKSCQIEYHPDPRLAVHTCELVGKRAKYLPAHWIDGSPAYGIDRFPVIWAVQAEEITFPPDLDVYLDRLPRGVHSPVYVPVVIAVGTEGKIERCAADQRQDAVSGTLKGHISDDPALVAAACQQSELTLKTFPAVADDGKPVRSVQNALVRFSVKRQ